MESRFLTGSVEVLILQIAKNGPTYGYEITQEAMKRSGGYFNLKEGSLYPALHRLESRGLLEASWEAKETGRRRKFYRLTPEGAKALTRQRKEWKRFAAGVNGVLGLQG